MQDIQPAKPARLARSPRVQLWAILAIVFYGFLGLSIPYLIFPPLFLNSFAILPDGTSEPIRALWLGVTLAVYPFGQFLGSPILGALSDDLGRRNIMAVSLAVAGFCSLLSALALEWGQLWLLIASRFFAGLMEGNLAIARAMAADLKRLRKHETFGKINAVSSLAFVIGPFAGGLLADPSVHPSLSYATPFYVVFLLFLVLSVVSRLVIAVRPLHFRVPERSFTERINLVARLRRLLKNRLLRVALLVSTLQTLAVDLFYEFGPVYLTAIWNLGPSNLVIYTSALSLTLVIGAGYVSGKLAGCCPDEKIVSWSIGAFTLCLISIAMFPHPTGTLVMFFLIGFPISIAGTNLTVQVSDAVADNIQGEVMGVQTSFRVLGDAVICLVGGALLAVSPALVLGVAAVIAFGNLSYYLWRVRFKTSVQAQS